MIIFTNDQLQSVTYSIEVWLLLLVGTGRLCAFSSAEVAAAVDGRSVTDGGVWGGWAWTFLTSDHFIAFKSSSESLWMFVTEWASWAMYKQGSFLFHINHFGEMTARLKIHEIFVFLTIWRKKWLWWMRFLLSHATGCTVWGCCITWAHMVYYSV